ncbi:MAG TPA: sulfatase-like hydrolase/transferase [Hyphomicrobiaceae bacterium]|nr:sulfatase-like hydrolase/transferase [Hyphomicrobiaceae bacterium]
MTEREFDLPSTPARFGAGRMRLAPLPARTVWASAAALLGGMVVHSWSIDGDAGDVLFVSGAVLTLGALVLLVSRRLLVATVLVAAIITLLRTVAVLKQEPTGVVLHAYDVAYFVRSWSGIVGLWHDNKGHAAGLLAASAAVGLLAWIAWRLDSTRLHRVHGLAAVAIFAMLTGVGAFTKDVTRHTAFYFEDRYLSFWLSSWPDTIRTLWRGHLMDASRNAPGPALSLPAGCTPAGKPPHIILIHQESVVPPHYFPSVRYDKTIDPLFQSFDGKVHKLRVETYGGASWLTEFSALTGLSALSLGGLHQFAQTIMAGKMRETLPQALARCGYRNVAVHPMLRIYLAIGKFFDAVGFHQMLDATDQGATSSVERDRFYYASALAEMERHFKASRQPLFVFVETMATHGPYTYTYMPEVEVPGGGPGTSANMHEYLRRLAMTHQDYAFLLAELHTRFPSEQFLIVQYGDHQPLATLPLLGFREDVYIEDVMQSGNQAALMTYYAVDGVRYRPPPLPELEVLDIPYLGTVMLDAAGLPLSDAYRERKRLMAVCKGRHHGCPEILEFNRRLIDSRIVDAL